MKEAIGETGLFWASLALVAAVLVLTVLLIRAIRYSRERMRQLRESEERLFRQKQITEAVILAQEKERTEIGKELHDNVNQILGASNLYINTAMTDEEMRQELLERSTQLVSNAINEIRKISKSLITPGLREIGLIELIGDVMDDLKVAKNKMVINLDLREYFGGADRGSAEADAVQDRSGAIEQYREACRGHAGTYPVIRGAGSNRADRRGQWGGI